MIWYISNQYDFWSDHSLFLTDFFKGSFYANPILDIPTTDFAAMQRYDILQCLPSVVLFILDWMLW